MFGCRSEIISWQISQTFSIIAPNDLLLFTCKYTEFETRMKNSRESKKGRRWSDYRTSQVSSLPDSCGVVSTFSSIITTSSDINRALARNEERKRKRRANRSDDDEDEDIVDESYLEEEKLLESRRQRVGHEWRRKRNDAEWKSALDGTENTSRCKNDEKRDHKKTMGRANRMNWVGATNSSKLVQWLVKTMNKTRCASKNS